MFENLIETKPKKPKTGKQLLLSVVLHILAIGGAVYGTLEAKEAIEKPKAEKVEFVEMKKEEPPPPETKPEPPPEVVAAPPTVSRRSRTSVRMPPFARYAAATRAL